MQKGIFKMNRRKAEKRRKELARIIARMATFMSGPIIAKLFKEFVQPNLFSTIFISETMMEFVEGYLNECFHGIPECFQSTLDPEIGGVEFEVNPIFNAYCVADTSGKAFCGYGLIDGIPCKITVETTTHEGDRNKAVTITTFKIADYPQRVKAKLIDVQKKESQKRIKEQNHYLNRFDKARSRKRLRSFDSIFLEKEIRDQIKHTIDEFISKRAWYREHNIPYHLGILLYGNPGTGKTSISQAIAEYAETDALTVSGDDLHEITSAFSRLETTWPVNKNSIKALIVEDIDVALNSNAMAARNDKDTNIGLATILNYLDGSLAAEDSIIIFTTNHIERLDPALIRAGRMDLKIEIPNINNETLADFIEAHYGLGVDIRGELKPNLTFADLQIKVMQGCSANDIVQYCIMDGQLHTIYWDDEKEEDRDFSDIFISESAAEKMSKTSIEKVKLHLKPKYDFGIKEETFDIDLDTEEEK